MPAAPLSLEDGPNGEGGRWWLELHDDLRLSRLSGDAAWVSLSGLQTGTLGGWLDTLEPSSARALGEAVALSVRHHGVGLDVDVPCRSRSGDRRWLWLRGRVRPAADGASVMLLGTAVDVTIRRQREDMAVQREERLQAVLQQVPAGVSYVLIDSMTGRANRRYCDMLGYDAEELAALRWQDITHPDDIDAEQRLIERLLAGDVDEFRLDKRYIHKRGRIIWAALHVRLVRDAQQNPLYLITVADDITDRRRAQQQEQALLSQLAASEARLRSLLEAMPDSVWFKDLKGCYQLFNQRYANQCGQPADAIIGRTDAELFPVELAGRFVASDGRAYATNGPVTLVEERVAPGTGSTGAFEVVKCPVHDSAGHAVGVLGISRDVTSRTRAERQREEVTERLELVLAGADLALWDHHIPSGSRTVNDRWYSMLGLRRGEVDDHFEAWQQRIHPDDRERMLKAKGDHLSGLVPYYECEYRMRHQQGHWVWILSRGKVVEWDAEGRPVRLSGTNMDITQRKQIEEMMARSAQVDPLTGAESRRHFLAMAEAELQRANRHQLPLAVLMIDLDHFKRVNDQWGHAAGDAVLVGVARALAGTLRQADQFGRLGGEEFAVVLPHTDAEGGRTMAQRLMEQVREVEVPWEGQVLQVTISVGGASRRVSDLQLQGLLRRADLALYEAKAAGRNRVAWES